MTERTVFRVGQPFTVTDAFGECENLEGVTGTVVYAGPGRLGGMLLPHCVVVELPDGDTLTFEQPVIQ